MCILASERLTHCPSTFGNDQLLLRNTSKHDYQGLSWLLPASCFVEEKVGIPYMVRGAADLDRPRTLCVYNYTT